METEPVRVLVIDDDGKTQDELRQVLVREAYEVDRALSAAQGLEMMARNSYRVVLVDLNMPGMDGLALLEEMRSRGFNVPAVMITSHPTIKTALRALRQGAVDYIPKSFTGRELLSLLSRVLRRRECAWGACDFEPEKTTSLEPGKKHTLPKHSWVRIKENGLAEAGLRHSFLNHLPEIVAIQAPRVGEMVEQGLPGLTLNTADEIHQVLMPLSGEVRELNRKALENPAGLDSETWLIRLLPRDLDDELARLRPEPD